MTNEKTPRKTVCRNKKVRYNYDIIDTYEAGLSLQGTEVKSLRNGKASINEAYIRPQASGLYLFDMHISPYTNAGPFQHSEKRPRQLLLHNREIRKIVSDISRKGLTAVPMDVHFSGRGWAKTRIAVCRGKKTYDKRDKMKKKEDQREMQREKNRRR